MTLHGALLPKSDVVGYIYQEVKEREKFVKIIWYGTQKNYEYKLMMGVWQTKILNSDDSKQKMEYMQEK